MNPIPPHHSGAGPPPPHTNLPMMNGYHQPIPPPDPGTYFHHHHHQQHHPAAPSHHLPPPVAPSLPVSSVAPDLNYATPSHSQGIPLGSKAAPVPQSRTLTSPITSGSIEISQPTPASSSSVPSPAPPTPTQTGSQTSSSSAPGKGKSPRKRKSSSKVSLPSTASTDSSGELTPSQNKCKDLKEYVQTLLSHKTERFDDIVFAERTLMNIAKKISVVPNDMAIWRRSVTDKNPEAGCVCITRPKDGRLTIARPDHNSTKKVFPQVLLCQAFRWPYIFFHSDIKSAENCKYQTVIKPPEKEPAGEVGESICINPYHYVITPEAQARFKRQGKSNDSGPTGANRKRTPKKPVSKPASNPAKATTTAGQGNNKQQQVKDEGFSESEPLDFDDEGIDYVKMWKERRIAPNKLGVQKFDENEILKEIEFMNVNNKTINDKLKQKMVAEIKKNILSGEYIKGYIKKNYDPEKDDLKRPTPKKTDSIRMSSEDQEDSNMSEDVAQTTKAPLSDDSAAPTEEAPRPSEDNAIQDLLDDIQGSFERQFDEEFENLSAEDLEAAAAAAANAGESNQPGSMQFPNMDTTTFNNMVTNFGEPSAGTSGQPQQPQPQDQYGHPPTHTSMYDPGSAMINANAGLPMHPTQPPPPSPSLNQQQHPSTTTAENPCIVNSWTMGTPDPSYVNPVHGAPVRQNSYNEYYSGQQPPAQQQHLHHQDMMYGQQQQYNPHYQYQGYDMNQHHGGPPGYHPQ